MKALLVFLSLFCISPTFAMGPSRPCSQQPQQLMGGKGGGGQGQQQQQQCQQQQQQTQQQGKGGGKGGVCSPLFAACVDAGYTGANVSTCVDNILQDKESEIPVYYGDKVACGNFRATSPAGYDAWKTAVNE